MGRKPASDPLNEQILNAIHSGKMCTKLRKDCTADEKKGIEKSINEIVNKFQNDEGSRGIYKIVYERIIQTWKTGKRGFESKFKHNGQNIEKRIFNTLTKFQNKVNLQRKSRTS